MIYWIANKLLSKEKNLPYNILYLLLDILFVILSITSVYLLGGFQSIVVILLLLYFLIICITDFARQIIPDKLTYLYVILGLLISFIEDSFSILDALIGGLTGFLLLYLIAFLGEKIFKKEAMGGGDIKLAAMLGVFIGWKGIIISLFIACFLALIYVILIKIIFPKKFLDQVPFGPFLLLAGFVFKFCLYNLLSDYILTSLNIIVGLSFLTF